MILILGWQMQKVAIGWEIYERTHSAMALGYAGLAQFFPQVLFMLFAGHITDRHNRKHVLMAALSCNALAAVGLAVNSARGGSIDDIIKVVVWAKDKSFKEAVNKEWLAMFPDEHSRPARHTMLYQGFSGNTLVQCEIVAVLSDK